MVGSQYTTADGDVRRSRPHQVVHFRVPKAAHFSIPVDNWYRSAQYPLQPDPSARRQRITD